MALILKLKGGRKMSVAENKTIVQRWWDRAGHGDLSVLDDLVGADYVYHNPATPGFETHEQHKQVILGFVNAFPDLEWTVDDVIAEADTVVLRSTFRGTHQGELLGVPPTGKRAEWPAIAIFRLADGKVVEEWVQGDMLGLMRQLGIVPT
jgi:steroid delta-isomerase-like uncharacterized protein